MEERIPWWEPKLGQPVRDAVLEVLDSAFINDGPTTRRLEARMAEITGVRYGIATPNCTSSLALVLMALGIGPGDEVIVPDMTFIATANAVRLTGAAVRLADIEPERLTIDPAKVLAAIGPRTKAVIAVDFNGRAADYPALHTVCAEAGVALFSDAAQALGSRPHGRACGSHALAGCFSFSGHKMFFAGQGGMIVTDDDDLTRRLRNLRDHAKCDNGPLGDTHHASVGFNFKLTSLQAAVALAQLAEVNERLAHARNRDVWYREMMGGFPNLRFIRAEDGEVILWADVFSNRRDTIGAALHAAGVGSRRFYLPLHRQPPYAGIDADFPVANAIARTGLWLPSALSLTRDQVIEVAQIVRSELEAS